MKEQADGGREFEYDILERTSRFDFLERKLVAMCRCDESSNEISALSDRAFLSPHVRAAWLPGWWWVRH